MQHNYAIICLYLFIINNMWNNQQPLVVPAPNMMDASSRWLWTTPFLPPLSEVKSREKKGSFYASIPCTNIWGFWGCFRGRNQDQYQSPTPKVIVTNQILWTEAVSSWCAFPKVRRKAPKAWIPNDPTNSLLPKSLNPSYLHNNTF